MTFNRSGSRAYVTSLRNDETPEGVNPLATNPLITTGLLFQPGQFQSGPGQVNVYNTRTFQRTATYLVGQVPVNVAFPRGPFERDHGPLGD